MHTYPVQVAWRIALWSIPALGALGMLVGIAPTLLTDDPVSET